MFDYAASLNQKRKPTRRIFVSWIASCLAHSAILLVLIEYPNLLQGGLYHRFRAISLIANMLGAKSDDDGENWRTVAVLNNPSKMSAPSAATLKKYLFDWSKKEQGAPPVRIRWGDVQAALLDTPPMPRVRQEAKDANLSLPANPLGGAGAEEAAAGSSATIQSDSGTGKQGTVNLPPPGPAPSVETANNNPPSRIPESIKPSSVPAPAASDAVKVFESEQKAIRSRDTGFFDTKGFPLGEYTSLIIERIKGKWFIPSNLRNSQGHTTVVFYINRDGRSMNARIVMGSGNNSLDLAALNAVLESNPFPPLPKAFPGDHVGAKFVFSYNEPQ